MEGAGAEGFDLASAGAGVVGCTPYGAARCSMARANGRFGRSASLGQSERMRVYCLAIYGMSVSGPCNEADCGRTVVAMVKRLGSVWLPVASTTS